MSRYATPLIWTLGILACLELLLEYRSYQRGYDTLLFGRASLDTSQTDSVAAFGPTESFPFRSLVVGPEKPDSTLRIWIASASHAHDARMPADVIFPHLLAENLNAMGGGCEVLNASLPGLHIADNIATLQAIGPKWSPDIVIVYQLSMDMLSIARGSAPAASVSITQGLGSSITEQLNRLVEKTTTYELLKSNVTSRINSQSVLRERLPEYAGEHYLRQLSKLVDVAKQQGAKVFVCTFCFSHPSLDLPEDYKLVLLKAAPDLAPKVWADSAREWNSLIRKQDEIDVIDLSAAVSGNPEYFRDPVHFSRAGHDVVAKRIATHLNSVQTQNSQSGQRAAE